MHVMSDYAHTFVATRKLQDRPASHFGGRMAYRQHSRMTGNKPRVPRVEGGRRPGIVPDRRAQGFPAPENQARHFDPRRLSI
jgi:hypothetical protein